MPYSPTRSTASTHRVSGGPSDLPPLASHPSSANLSIRESTKDSKAKSAVWMKKLRKWKSKDDGLWGCQGDLDEEDGGGEYEEDEEEDYGRPLPFGGERVPRPPPLEESYRFAYISRGPYSSGSFSGGSRTSSARSSMRSSTLSTHSGMSMSASGSGLSGGYTSPSATGSGSALSTRSAKTSPSAAHESRADLLAREQEDALAAISSYMAQNSQRPSLAGRGSSGSLTAFPTSPNSPIFPYSPAASLFPPSSASAVMYGPTGTVRGPTTSERRPSVKAFTKGSCALASAAPAVGVTYPSGSSANQRSFAHSPPPYPSHPGIRRSPSTASMAHVRLTAAPLSPFLPLSRPSVGSVPPRPTRPRAASSAADVKLYRKRGIDAYAAEAVSPPPLPNEPPQVEAEGAKGARRYRWI